MTTYAGPILTLDGLIFNLDVFNTSTWNIGRSLWKDLSTKKNNATFVGIPTLDNVNGSFDFANGNSHHISHVSNDGASIGDFEFGTGDFTIEVWIYPQSFSTYTHMFCLDNQNTFALKADITNGNIYFTSTAFNTFNHAALSTWTLTLNQWNHVVLKRQNGVAFGYLNGQLKGSKTGFTNNIPGNLTALIRNGGVAEYSQCKIRTVRAYNKSLTDLEIYRNYLNFSQRTYKAPTVASVFSTLIAVATRSATIGVQSQPYVPVVASGGFGVYTYSISPALPNGMSLDIDSGEISGLPTGIASGNFTITVKDALGTSSSRVISFSVVAPPITVTRIISSRSLPVNQAGVNFTPIVGTDGFGTLTYSISPSLSTGLSFNTSTGAITGTPTALRTTTTYTVTITDQVTPTPQTANSTFTLDVFPAPLSVSVATSTLSAFVTTSFSATPVLGSGGFGSLTYSINPALPAGLSLTSSTGLISGTPSSASASTNYTITVTDQTTPTAQTGTGIFNLSVTAGLYSFSSFTFTTAGTVGETGPTLATLLSTYNTGANPWLNNASYFNVSNGIQQWTVPITGSYTIESAGSRSSGRRTSGQGVIIRSTFNLTQGDVINILVGQPERQLNLSTTPTGGGGGTFVVKRITPLTSTQASDILIIAGGGGGSHDTNVGGTLSSADASYTTSGNAGTPGGSAGGTSGSGGNWPTGNGSSGGAGFLSDGQGRTQFPGDDGSLPRSYLNGGTGGGLNGSQSNKGGFGGGGFTWYQSGWGGGGGGYSGGGTASNSSYNGYAGGGGSITNGTNTVQVGLNNAAGYVTIIKL